MTVRIDSPRRSTLLRRDASRTFLVLVASSVVLLIGVTAVSLWRVPGLVSQILHICRAGWEELSGHLPAIIALILPAALFAGWVRGTATLALQLWKTRRHLRHLAPLLHPMPQRLGRLAEELGIGRQVAFVASDQPFAFCGGYWRPQVWVSAGLLAFLDDQELAAVLRHEAHHLQQRDPLRLLVVRTLREALFFLPAVRLLSGCYEVEQEISADRAAGDMLRLASALHKLLVLDPDQSRPNRVALSGLNVTETRIRRLIQPESGLRVTWCRPSVIVSLAVVLIVLGVALAPTTQLPPYMDLRLGACEPGPLVSMPATFMH